MLSTILGPDGIRLIGFAKNKAVAQDGVVPHLPRVFDVGQFNQKELEVFFVYSIAELKVHSPDKPAVGVFVYPEKYLPVIFIVTGIFALGKSQLGEPHKEQEDQIFFSFCHNWSGIIR